MTMIQTMPEQAETTPIQAAKPEPTKAKIVVVDQSPFASLLDTGRFEHLWRVAQLFAGSQLVPGHFQGNPADCFIGVQMAIRLGVEPFMLLQNMYVVHGKPGFEAKFAIGLINQSGLFASSLDYEIDGDDASSPAYRVRAFATRNGAMNPTYGPWVDWKMVKAEGWLDKRDSKWKTIPSLMFQYRAAVFFGRLHCPERLMGMQTAEELQDVYGFSRPTNAKVFTGRRVADPLEPDVHAAATDDAVAALTDQIGVGLAGEPPAATAKDAEDVRLPDDVIESPPADSPFVVAVFAALDARGLSPAERSEAIVAVLKRADVFSLDAIPANKSGKVITAIERGEYDRFKAAPAGV